MALASKPQDWIAAAVFTALLPAAFVLIDNDPSFFRDLFSRPPFLGWLAFGWTLAAIEVALRLRRAKPVLQGTIAFLVVWVGTTALVVAELGGRDSGQPGMWLVYGVAVLILGSPVLVAFWVWVGWRAEQERRRAAVVAPEPVDAGPPTFRSP